MKFSKGLKKVAAGLSASAGSAISKGFNESTGAAGNSKMWSNLKGMFGGATAPPPPPPNAGTLSRP